MCWAPNCLSFRPNRTRFDQPINEIAWWLPNDKVGFVVIFNALSAGGTISLASDSFNGEAGSPILKVFFSYSRTDKARAEPIIRALEQAGFDVWWDGMLAGGAKYIEKTQSALQDADVVVVLWTDTSVQSHWVQDEAMHGRDNKCLVPISLDHTEPPLGFRQFQVIDLSRWDGAQSEPSIQNVIRSVEALAARVEHVPELLPERFADRLSRRRLLLFGAVGGLGLASATAIWAPWRSKSTKISDGSIAVLPFENDSRDPDQDYLSIGIANELRNSLARNSGLRVMARSSSENVKRRQLTPDAIARELGVAFVVEGAVQVIEGRVDVVSSLIESVTGHTLWSGAFSQPIEELLDVQRTITEAISAELALGVSTAQGQAKIGAATNAAAFDSYLRGWTIYRNSVTAETDMLALERFDNAIALDPGFAAAHAARSATLTVLGNTSDSRERANLYYEQAMQAARRAIELGPDLDEAHSVLALALFETQLNIAEALPVYERSLELGLGSAIIQARYAEYAALTGRAADALRAIELAAMLDPLNPTIHRSFGNVHYAAGRYNQAIHAYERALALSDGLSDAHAWSAFAYLELGQADLALSTCQEESHGLVKTTCLSIVHHRLGNDQQSQDAMNELIGTYGDNGLYQQAQVMAQRGETQAAINTLQTALEKGDAGLTYLGMDPLLDPIRSHPDFIVLQNTLGFT